SVPEGGGGTSRRDANALRPGHAHLQRCAGHRGGASPRGSRSSFRPRLDSGLAAGAPHPPGSHFNLTWKQRRSPSRDFVCYSTGRSTRGNLYSGVQLSPQQGDCLLTSRNIAVGFCEAHEVWRRLELFAVEPVKTRLPKLVVHQSLHGLSSIERG